jgi:sarcosine oxidase
LEEQMRPTEFDADVAVVGLGAVGANALWRLTERGLRVIGIERFHPGHVLGSSHGKTRVFRVACLEHPNLVPLARRSRDLWAELQAASGAPVIRLSRSELQARFPQHQNLAPDHMSIRDPEAGVVHPEAGVVAAVNAARVAGATVYTDTKVTEIVLVDGGAVVTTPTGRFVVPQVVVTTGAWLNKLVPDLPLTPPRTPMMWFEPADRNDRSFRLESFPTFIRAVDAGNWIWGHGSGEGFAVKVGPDRDPNFREVDPDTVDRGISPADWNLVSELVAKALPGLDPVPVLTTTCMVAHSPDGHFQILRRRSAPDRWWRMQRSCVQTHQRHRRDHRPDRLRREAVHRCRLRGPEPVSPQLRSSASLSAPIHRVPGMTRSHSTLQQRRSAQHNTITIHTGMHVMPKNYEPNPGHLSD